MMRRLIIGAITLGLCLLGHRSGAENVSAPNGYTLLRAVRTKAEGVNAGQIRAYIDTGYVPTSLDLGFDFDFAYHSALSPSNGKRIMGAGGKLNDKWSGLFLSGTTIAGTEGGGTFYFGKMSSPINPGLKQNERVLLRVRNHALKSSAGLDEALTATEQKFDGSSILLGRNGTALSDKASTSADITIYGFKIYEGDMLVANFIPVRRNEDGAVGLLDIAGNQGFRGNAAGEGELAAVELSDAPPSLVITSSLGDGVAAQLGEVFPGYGVEAGLQAGEKIAIGLLIGEATDSFCSGWKLYHQEGENWVLDQVGSGPLEYVQGSVPTKLEWQWHQLVLNGFEAIKNGGIESGTWIKNDGAYGNNNGTDAFTEDWTGGRISKAGGGFSVPNELVKGTYCMIAQGDVTLSQKISIPAAGAGVLSFSCARRGGKYNPNTPHYLTVSLGGQVVVDNASITGDNVQQKSFDLGQVPAGETTLEFVFSQSSGDLATFLEDISLKVTSKESSDEGTFIISSSVDGERGAPQPAYGSYSGFAAGDPLSARMENAVVTNGIEVLSCVGWRLYGYDHMTDGWELRSEGAGTAFAGVFAYPRMKLEWVWLTTTYDNYLGADITPLEYVSFGSTFTYVDTGLAINDDEIAYRYWQQRYASQQQIIGSAADVKGVYEGEYNKILYFGTAATQFEVFKAAPDPGFIREVIYNKRGTTNREIWFDGEKFGDIGSGRVPTTQGKPLWIGKRGSQNVAFIGNFYSFKITAQDGTVRADYLPAQNAAGQVGFYDKATKGFILPAQGTLTAGPKQMAEPPCVGTPGTVAVEGVPAAYAQVYPSYGIYDMPTEPIVCAAPEAPTGLDVVVRCRGYRLFELNGEEWAEVASGEENSFTLMPSEKPMRLEWLWEAHTETYHATIAGVQKLSEIAWLDVNNQRVSWETVRLSARELQITAPAKNNPRIVFDEAISFENLVLSGATTFELAYAVTPTLTGGVVRESGATYALVYPVENTDGWGQDLAVEAECKVLVIAGASDDESVWSGTIETSESTLLAFEGNVTLASSENDIQGGVEIRALARVQASFKDGTFKGKLTLKENGRFAALDDPLVLPFSNASASPALELCSGAEIFGSSALLASIPDGPNVSKRFCVSVVREEGSSEASAVITAPILLAGSDNSSKPSTLELNVDSGAKLTLRGAIKPVETAVNVDGINKVGFGHLDFADGFALDESLTLTVSAGSFGVNSPLTLKTLTWNGGAAYRSQEVLTIDELSLAGSGSHAIDMTAFVTAKPWAKRFFVMASPTLNADGVLDALTLTGLPDGEWEKTLRGTLLTVTLPDLDTDWTGLGGDFAWTNALNWTRGVPRDGMYVTITNVAAGTSIALPEGATAYLAELTLSGESLEFSGGTLQADTVVFDGLDGFAFAGEELRVSRALKGEALELAAESTLVISNDIPITVSTVIVGEGGVAKKGVGMLTLAGENGYRGGFAARSGFTVAAAEGAVTGAVTVASGASLDANGFGGIDALRVAGFGDDSLRPWAFASAADLPRPIGSVALAADAALGGAGMVVFGGGDSPALALDGHRLIKIGLGDLVFTNAVSTGGSIEIKEGTLAFLGTADLTTGPTAFKVAAGATLRGEIVDAELAPAPLIVPTIENLGIYRSDLLSPLEVTERFVPGGTFAALAWGDAVAVDARAGAVSRVEGDFALRGAYDLVTTNINFAGRREGDRIPVLVTSAPFDFEPRTLVAAAEAPPLKAYLEEGTDGKWTFGVECRVLAGEIVWSLATDGDWTDRDFNGERQVYDNRKKQSVNFADSTNRVTAALTVRVVGEKTISSLVFSNDLRSVCLTGDAVEFQNLTKVGANEASLAVRPRTTSLSTINVREGSLVFDVPEGETWEIPARIVGAGMIKKRGSGTLVLNSEANDYSGGTQVECGTLKLGAFSALGREESSVYVYPLATLDVNGTSVTNSAPRYQLELRGGELVNNDPAAETGLDRSYPFKTIHVAEAPSALGGRAPLVLGAKDGEVILIKIEADCALAVKSESTVFFKSVELVGAGTLTGERGNVVVCGEGFVAREGTVGFATPFRLEADMDVAYASVSRSISGPGTLRVRDGITVKARNLSVASLSLDDKAKFSGVDRLSVADALRLGSILDVQDGNLQNGDVILYAPEATDLSATILTLRGQGEYRVYYQGGALKFFNPPKVTYRNFRVKEDFQGVSFDVTVSELTYGRNAKNASFRAVVMDERGAKRENPVSGGSVTFGGRGSADGHFEFVGLEFGHNYYTQIILTFDGIPFALGGDHEIVTANTDYWFNEDVYTFTHPGVGDGKWVYDDAAVSVEDGEIAIDPSFSEREEVVTTFTPTNAVVAHSGYTVKLAVTPTSAYAPGDLPTLAKGAPFAIALGHDEVDSELLAFYVAFGNAWQEVPRSRIVPRLGTEYLFTVVANLRGNADGLNPKLSYYADDGHGNRFLAGGAITANRRVPDFLELNGFMRLESAAATLNDDSLVEVSVRYSDGDVIGENFTNLAVSGSIDLRELCATTKTNGIAYIRIRSADGALLSTYEVNLAKTHAFDWPSRITPGGVYLVEVDVALSDGGKVPLRITGDNDLRSLNVDARKTDIAGGWIREDAETFAGIRPSTGVWDAYGDSVATLAETPRGLSAIDYSVLDDGRFEFTATNAVEAQALATTRTFAFRVLNSGGETPYRFWRDIAHRTGEDLPEGLRMGADEIGGVSLAADDTLIEETNDPTAATNLVQKFIVFNPTTREWELAREIVAEFDNFRVTNTVTAAYGEEYLITTVVNYGNPLNGETSISYYLDVDGDMKLLAGFTTDALPALGEAYTNRIALAGSGSFVSLAGDLYDAHLAEVNGEEYWTIEEALEHITGEGDALVPLWRANYTVTKPSGRFSVIDPDGLFRVIWGDHAYETERIGDIVWYFYAPEDNWIGFADDLHLAIENGVYTVNDARALAWIARESTNAWFDCERVELGRDIDLTRHDWTPIHGFTGVFDGAGHVVKGLKTGDYFFGPTNDAGITAYALVASASNSVFRNVVFDEVCVTNASYAVAALLGCSLGELAVSNVWVRSGVIRGETAAVAGVVGLAEDYPYLAIRANTNTAVIVGAAAAPFVSGIANFGGFTSFDAEGPVAEVEIVGNVNQGALAGDADYSGNGNLAEIAAGTKPDAVFNRAQAADNVGTGTVVRLHSTTEETWLREHPIVNFAGVLGLESGLSNYADEDGQLQAFKRYIEANDSPDFGPENLILDPVYHTARLTSRFFANGTTNETGILNDYITSAASGSRVDLGKSLALWDPIEIDRDLTFNMGGFILDAVYETSLFKIMRDDVFATISNGIAIVYAAIDEPLVTGGEEHVNWETNEVVCIPWSGDYYMRDVIVDGENDPSLTTADIIRKLGQGEMMTFYNDGMSLYGFDVATKQLTVANIPVFTFAKGYGKVTVVESEDESGCPIVSYQLALETIDLAEEIDSGLKSLMLDFGELLKDLGDEPVTRTLEIKNATAACEYALQSSETCAADWPKVLDSDWKRVARDGDSIVFTVTIGPKAGFFRLLVRENSMRTPNP